MVDDVVRAFGYATLGSRLKRIGERLQMQTQDLCLEPACKDLPVPNNPVLAALDLHGAMSIGGLAKALGQSQPGITRMIKKMTQDGLARVKSDPKDKRISLIELTEKGTDMVTRLKASLWVSAELSVADACKDLSGTFLEQLDQLEDALVERPLSQRQPSAPLPDWDTLKQDRRQR